MAAPHYGLADVSSYIVWYRKTFYTSHNDMAAPHYGLADVSLDDVWYRMT